MEGLQYPHVRITYILKKPKMLLLHILLKHMKTLASLKHLIQFIKKIATEFDFHFSVV